MNLLHHAFRIFVTPASASATEAFYEELQGIPCQRRLSMPDIGIEVAIVGAFVILAGSDEALAPYRSTSALLVVDDVDEAITWAQSRGAVVVHGPVELPNGRNVALQHPDGLIAEYFEAARST